MTYCVGVLVDDGLVMIADTRTNAGIDNISIYIKLHTLADTDERLLFACTAGSLSVTQSMLSLLEEGLPCLDDTGIARTIGAQPTMFRVAQLVGEALSTAKRAIGTTLEGSKVSASASVLVGGRIADGPLTLFQIYAEGNFIECQPDAPFLQIGELKYGKPILDRALTYETALDEAVKVALISFDERCARTCRSAARSIWWRSRPTLPANPSVYGCRKTILTSTSSPPTGAGC